MSIPEFALLILVNLSAADKGSYAVLADGREIAQFKIEGSEGVSEIRLSVPAGSRRLTLERKGVLSGVGINVGRRSKTFDLVSVAGVTGPLRDERPVDALKGLAAAADVVLREIGSEYSVRDIGLDFGAKQTPDAIAEAEARLGYKIDPELADVLTMTGPVKFGDHGMVAAADLVTTERQFMRLWGNEENVSGDALALYRASTMIWLEAGDGYGAVVYAPKGSGPRGGAPSYWRIHQDTIDAPQPIGNVQRGSGNLSDVLMRVVGEDLLVHIEDNGTENQLLVDPSMPNEFPVWLEADGDGDIALRPDWSRLE